MTTTAKSSSARLATTLALLSLTVSLVTAAAQPRAAHRLLQSSPAKSSGGALTGDLSGASSGASIGTPSGMPPASSSAGNETDAIAKDAESAKSRAAAAVATNAARLAAATAAKTNASLTFGERMAANGAWIKVMVAGPMVKMAADQATTLANNALDFLQAAADSVDALARAQARVAAAQAKVAAKTGFEKVDAQKALSDEMAVADAHRSAGPQLIADARQSVADAFVYVARAEAFANK